jgi:putative ABC transport system permease protein
MAVGARGRDVTRQFLTEAVAISLAGGAVGVVVGLVASYLIASTLRWATVVSPAAVFIAFGVSAAVGVLFGWYPARRAAELDPIDALRHE